MPAINILSPHLADMIAAGEVVERPASVIKEFVENSFDAGAKNVTVEIRNGGTTYIRVTDDGCGMSPEDAGIAFLRHATSKLHDEAGLTSIGTMGFRGEALAAISAVSHMEILTREKGSAEGTRLILDAGEISEMVPFGCPEGTTVICRDLFFNTPARLKFLKSDRSEAASCSGTALRCALGRPDVSVRFIKDGEEDFFSPGDGKAESCLYSLLGRDEASGMIPCASNSPSGMSISGFISSPAHCRGNRSHQYFFVNGRCIRSVSIQTALEQAYKNSLLTGRYPSCVLFLSIDLASVDVNVHPAKTEVRFGAEKAVFDLVYHSVRLALESEDTLVSAARSPSVSYSAASSSKSSSPARNTFYKTMSIDEFRSAAEKLSATPAKSPVSAAPKPSGQFAAKISPAAEPLKSSWPEKAAELKKPVSPVLKSEPFSPAENSKPVSKPEPSSPAENSKPVSKQESSSAENSNAEEKGSEVFASFAQNPDKSRDSAPSAPAVEKNVENSVQNVESFPLQPYKILGEAFKTYIIVEQNNELILIDKHAAHERMIFNRLKAQERELPSQYLLAPVTARFSSDDAELIGKNSDLLSRLGFEIEPYGDLDFIIRSVPADMSASDILPAIEEICEKIRSNISPDPSSVRDEILHTVACKAAIKAGWNTDAKEMEAIAKKVLSGEIKYCPHGRPVSSVITRSDLDKLFKRIV